jgi:hypothetical protein
MAEKGNREKGKKVEEEPERKRAIWNSGNQETEGGGVIPEGRIWNSGNQERSFTTEDTENTEAEGGRVGPVSDRPIG